VKVGLQAEGIASRYTRNLDTAVFLNISIALRIFISLPSSVSSCERTFNMLKQVKNYYRSIMGQYRANGFATLKIDCSSIIDAFSEKKPRKGLLHTIFSLLN
jgi:hypothetical protein